MSQRYDIVHIDFQANARGANAAIESMRQGADRCKQQVKDLKEQLEKGKKANLPTAEIQKLEDSLKAARKEFRQWDSAYNQLIKGMRTLDIAVKAFNDGSLAKMNAAFQKSAYNAAKLQKTRLNPESGTFKQDSMELQALMDAAQKNLSQINTVANQVIKTIQNGGKVSRNAVTEELQQQKELLFVLSETDKGYAQTQRRVAMLEHILKTIGGSYDYIRQNISDTNKVSDETLRKMYDELQQVNNAGQVTQQVMRGNATAMREIRKEQNRRVESVLGGDLGKQSEASIRNAIANARELIQVYGTSSKRAQTLAAQIVNAESYLKTVGVEAARATRQQADAIQLAADKYKMMQERIKNIGSLSQGALAETQKFWQAQLEGATVGSAAYKRAERALNAIAKQQRELTIAMSQQSASKLSRKNLSILSESELRESINAAKQLAASMKPTDKAYKDLINNIIRAEEYVKSFGLEGQRSAHQAAEQMKVMNDRMLHLSTLSDGALEETRKFWQEQMNGAERGSKAYTEFETKLQEVVNRQKQLSVSQNKQTAATLPNFQNMGEGEIRRAIEAAREYQKTLKIDSDEYRNLSKNIVDAESYVRKYGVEAQRSAQKDIEAQEKVNAERQKTIQLMQDQLQKQGAGLSESALKAQHQYWQRLIDDPKTAASSLQDYKENLKVVEDLQNQMMITQGRNALAFFRGDTGNASADQIKQNADALKVYRDSLPRQNEAAIIQEINGYLAQAGQSASGAASQMMSLRDAFRIGLQGGNGSFKGTPEQLRQAKQVLEETLATTDKGSKRFEQLRRALDGIALEEKRVGAVTKEMQAVLDQPKGRSFNELKIAVEEGRKQLNSMSRTTKEAQKSYDKLAAKVRAADLELKTLQNTEKGTTSSFEKAVSRLKTYITLYMGTAVAIQKLGTTVSDLMTLSDKMGEVRKTTGFTAEQVGRLSDNLTKLDTRTPVQNLMEISAAAGQLGLTSLEDVQGFTEAANMMLIALPEMGQEAATEMMKIAIATGEVKKIQDQMRKGIIEGSSASAVAMEKIGSTIDRLRATTAASAPPIADFVKRVGAVGAQSGITVDQVAALGATVNSLGMGTEMAATVVSRMIPALKNHAFDLAQAIGVAPDTIRNLVDGGKGMEAILMILQHIKEQNLNADGIDKLLGIGGMGEIMKELDQRGARAGIVFAGLSQNVDELRKNLITANDAYTEGTAILDEYNKMNDTTAAKWERLKNQMEEFFVSDANQRFFGKLIDALRVVVDLLTGDGGISVAFRALIVLAATWRLGIANMAVGVVQSFSKIGEAIGLVKGKMTALQKSNIWLALAAAVAYVAYKFITYKNAVDKASEALGKAKENIAEAEERFEGYWKKIEITNNALRKAQAYHNSLSEEVDKLRQSTDKGSAATTLLSKKQEDLKNSENAVTKASNAHRVAIGNLNSIYSKYLGFLLTERNYAILAADAHDKVAAAIRREMLAKEKDAAISEVRSKYTSDIASDYGDLNQLLVNKGGLKPKQASRAMSALEKFLRTGFHYDSSRGVSMANADVVSQLNRSGLDVKGTTAQQIAALWFNDYLRRTYNLSDFSRSHITGVQWTSDFKSGWQNIYTPFHGNLRADYADKYFNRANEVGAVSEVFNTDIGVASDKEAKANANLLRKNTNIVQQAVKTITSKKATNEQVGSAYEELANSLSGLDKAIENMDPIKDAKTIAYYKNLADSINKNKGIDKKRLQKSMQNVQNTVSLSERALAEDYTTETVGNIPKIDAGISRNPWGENLDAASTDWGKMNAKELVARRKQMNEFVKALQGDTDVKSVLAEDPALMKAISEKKVSDDADSVIGWYNTQRLKIQDVLHSRFLTNTGSWKDPKNQRSAAKKVKDEMSYYMEELDAYYTERKSKIEEAQSNGEITEAESWKRTLENEQAWRQCRAELQEMYAGKTAKITADEQQKIYDILSLRTGDSSDMIKKTIGSTYGFIKAVGEKDAAAMHKILGKLDKDIEQDFLKMNKAVSKQVQAMVDIINKERPFNSLTENLQTNLQKMDLLVPELNKKLKEIQDTVEPDKNAEARMNDEIQRQTYLRTTFLLGEAENAYSMTWDKLEADMRKNGMGSWADAILGSEDADTAKQAVIAQLHSIYDDVQDAIKKEASLMKKQTEIQWNDAILPGNVSMKQTYERTAAALGVEQGRVSRANSMIGAGALSDNVASKLAIKQMQIQLKMQEHYYNLMRKIGEERVADLKRQEQEARLRGDINKADQLALDAKHAKMSLNLTLSEEENALAKQHEDIVARTEESQSKIYSILKDWSTLFASSLQSLFEASNTGLGDYYDSLAKMRLTGEGSAGGAYVVIENSGTENATAHYESLDGEEALKRQLEIQQQNAMADAWKKVMDDINNKISEQITDWINASLQNQALDNNTQALMQNTAALYASINSQQEDFGSDYLVGPDGVPNYLRSPESMDELPRAYRKRAGFLNDEQGETPLPVWPTSEEDLQQKQEQIGSLWTAYKEYGIAAKTEMAEALADVPGANSVLEMNTDQQNAQLESMKTTYQDTVDASKDASLQMISNQQAVNKTNTATSRQMVNTNKNAFAAMTAAANMYGIAYQAMSNDNLTTAQKVQMMIVQAAGQAAISMLTASMAASTGETAANAPGWVSRTLKDLGPIGGPVAVGVFTALIGGLMGLAMSKITKSKSQIAQVTGASAGAGRLSTGMLTYAEGNVNEFTDPSTLTPGRSYNVDGADGRTYRAKYMGVNPKTHITNGPEFHLVGERGREAIIDAQTTRQIQMDDTGIWHDIQTLYNGGSISAVRRRRSGVRAFASGNIDEFDDVVAVTDGSTSASSSGSDATAALQASLDRNSEVLERALRDGIKGIFDVYGKGGLVDSYDRAKKNVNRHGEKY
ncbi:phage tail tape measure protein [uncultured Prevotella sp.]|uniref:phage tail tape measure protein n=1 Tax=uncultured Prevotella sp. TaxID=159272 RepID=UPI0025F64D12|nr:phage tail tape measure protein [uncultured Prevotella sp.]